MLSVGQLNKKTEKDITVRVIYATNEDIEYSRAEQFELPPSFDSHQRKTFFSFQKSLLEPAQAFRKPARQIGFLLSCGYFNTTKRFLAPKDYQRRDINYVAYRLNIQPDSFTAVSYADRTRQRHEHIILAFYGFKGLDNEAADTRRSVLFP